MSADLIKQEWNLVVEQRGVDPTAVHREPYLTARYPKKSEEKALAGLADWEDNKQRILDSGAGYVVNWTAHVERRKITATPWERLET